MEMAATMDDRALDRRIRDVPTPDGLAARVAAGSFDDAALDRLLRDVSVPGGLPRRIAARAAAGPAPALVPAPARPRRAVRRRPWQGVVAAARDLAVVAAAVAGVWLVAEGGARLSTSLAEVSRPRAAAPAVAVRPREAPGAVALPVRRPTAPDAAVAEHAAERPSEAVAATPPPVPAAPVQALATIPDPQAEPPQVRGAGVGIGREERVWLRTPVRMPRESWRRVPRVRGYDLLFEMTHGEPPFVDPSAEGLRVDTPPLTVQTDTFDRSREAPSGRGAALRTEHVLAAVPPVGRGPRVAEHPVSLTVQGVRSLRVAAGRPTLLVEVAATADRFVGRSPDGPPVDATIVLDRAAGAEPLTWRWACRGLAAAAGIMRPSDRVSVVVAGPVPQVAIREATGPELVHVATALERLAPSATSDLDAALAIAGTTSGREAGTGTVIVVAQEGVVDTSGDEARAALGRWQERSAGGDEMRPDVPWSGPGFVLVDAGTEFEPCLPAVSFGRTAADAVAIRRALLAAVFGADTLVAGKGRLTVDFEPGSVSAYRLVGHRQSAVESLSEALPATLDLHVGETARAVYEVVPRTAAPVKAAARFAWGGGTGEQAVTAALDGRAADCSAMTPSPHGCELLLAVAAGEAAGGSVHAAPNARTAAAALVTRWEARGDLTPFGEVLAGLIEASGR
jgi:hypothetical protein